MLQFNVRGFSNIDSPFSMPRAENLVPVTNSGGPWDLVPSFDVQQDAGQVWEAIRSPM